MVALIEAQDLTKTYVANVLYNLSLSAEEGEALAIRGDNGSGKSTLLKLLAGLIKPTNGIVKRAYSGMIIGYVPEKFPHHVHFTAQQYLYHMGRIQGLTKPALQDRILSLLHQFHLDGQQTEAIHTFSKGMKQKVGMIQALLPIFFHWAHRKRGFIRYGL